MSAGIWVSVDGVEGAGKTTLSAELASMLPGAASIAEFSDGPIGAFLAAAVKESPHHISKSAGGQSLVFVGEFWERVETEILPKVAAGRIVIQDRGWLSKYAYQHAVMEPTLGVAASEMLDALFEHIPRPDVIVSLTAPIATIEARLIRRDGSCPEERRQFIARADAVFRELEVEEVDVVRLDSSTMTPSELADRIAQRLQ